MTELDLIGTYTEYIYVNKSDKWSINWGEFPKKHKNDLIIYLKVIITKWINAKGVVIESPTLLLYSNKGVVYSLYKNKFLNNDYYPEYCIENNIPYEIIDKTK